MIIIQLIYNLSVLVALSVFSVFVDTRFKREGLNGKLLQGFLFGATAVIGMNYPFVFAQGIIFDGRSIVISLCTLFFGPLSGFIAALMSGLFRIYLGGDGAVMGSLVITSSYLIGFYYFKQRAKILDKRIFKMKLYQMGLLVHIAMVFLLLTLPSKSIVEAIKVISFTVLGIYPIVTVLIGKILLDHEENQKYLKRLSDSEKKYQLLTEVAPVGIFRTDVAGKTTYVNPRWSEISSLSFEEALGDGWLKAVAPEDVNLLYEGWEKAVKNNGVSVAEYRFIRKDGSIAWVLGKSVPQIDSTGNVDGYIGTITDITERKLSEKTITESERNYREIFNSTSEAIFIHDLVTGEILDVNDAMLKMYGFENKNEALKYRIDQLSSDEPMYSMQKGLRHLENTINTGQAAFEWRAKRKNGEVFWVEISLRRTEIRAQKRILAVVRDVSERKYSQEAFRKSEERFRNIFKDNMAVMMLIDPESQSIVDANQAAEKYYGWKIDELRQMKIHNINNLSPEQIKVEMQKALAKKRNHFEFKHSLANGSVRDVEVFSSIISIDDKDFLHTIVHDITEKKSAAQRIKLLSGAIEQSPISVIITDQSANIEYVNRYLLNITGYALHEVLGNNPRFLNSCETPKAVYEDLWNTILVGRVWTGELLNKKKNGELYWESATIFPILNHNGDITHFVGIKEDITEKKKMVSELIAAKEKAEYSEKLKSEFLSQMSHEIRSPLNVTLNFASLLREELECQLNNNQIEYFENIESAGKRLMRTVDLILNVSEMQVGTYEPIWRNVDLLSEILALIANEYITLAHKKNLEFRFNPEISAAVVRCDKYSVHQIFVNLIDNAIKYTQHGFIALKISEDYQEKLIKVTIEDSGIGISEDYLDKLFNPFMQEDRGYSRRFDGNGLGLALVKKYCELNNAEIKVESEKGKGTIFTVEFSIEGNDKESDHSHNQNS